MPTEKHKFGRILWEGFETEVEESVDEGDVEIEEKADCLGDAEGEGADVNQKQDLFSSHYFSFDLRLAPEFGVSGGFVNAEVPTLKDVAAPSFWEEEREDKAKARALH